MTTIPETRRVAVAESPNSTVIKREPVPDPEDTQVLVKLEASGICATDLHIGQLQIPELRPTVNVRGHEGIGRIVKLGPNADTQKWKIGDRVSQRWIYGTCLKCEMCLSGHDQLCVNGVISGKDVDGCWTEYTLVNSDYLLAIPEDVNPAEAAPILCAGTTVYHALKTANISPGQWVAIVGAGGGLGHLAIQYAKAQELRVLAIDGGEEKRALCAKLGADAFIDFAKTQDLAIEANQITDGGAHGVLVTSSNTRAYEQAFTYVRQLGIIICIGITPKKMQFPVGPEYFVGRGVRLTGVSTGTTADTQEALGFLRSGKVKPIIVQKTLEDIPACLEQLEKGDAVGRFVVVF
ncbi:hypothetical protein OIDMADRAFT_60879 [Oidiodendron maius Zn]|uniref:Enoyl reductase (ER) domain-containing protein n=1 Tax=Oidiodendron maius (strain Zn) TaxID=913774 RepID=A0A0C3CWG7_OIDMZ|nr:hypothetical protein OIDMADRAFT_60879 [Oidiodendron maius Zn]